LSGYLQTAFGNWGTWANDALAAIQAAITTGMENLNTALTGFMGIVAQNWTDFGAAISTFFAGLLNNIIGLINGAVGSAQQSFNTLIGLAQGAAATIASILTSLGSDVGKVISDAIAAAGQAGGGVLAGLGKEIASGTANAFNGVAGAVQGGLDAAGNAVTGFWNWLTGHSYWNDMLAKLQNDTAVAMTQLDFTPVFKSLSSALKELATEYKSGQISAADYKSTLLALQEVYAKLTESASHVFSPQEMVAATASVNDFCTAFELIDRIVIPITQSVSAAITSLPKSMTEASEAVAPIMTKITTTTDGMAKSMTGSFQSISTNFSSMLSGMASQASSGMAQIVSTVSSALAQILSMVAQMSAAMVGHSIWPDMLAQMQGQTDVALGNIVSDFGGLFSGITAPAKATAPRGVETASGPAATMQTISVPVTVQVDGATIARTVETRLVQTRYRSSWRQ
jgi:predicted PurR-regulated permease PerM